MIGIGDRQNSLLALQIRLDEPAHPRFRDHLTEAAKALSTAIDRLEPGPEHEALKTQAEGLIEAISAYAAQPATKAA